LLFQPRPDQENRHDHPTSGRRRRAPGPFERRHYRSEWDERRGVFVRQPLHDWASHAADAARSFALGFETRSRLTPSSREDTAEQHYDMMRW
jgi:hypothetical protein